MKLKNTACLPFIGLIIPLFSPLIFVLINFGILLCFYQDV